MADNEINNNVLFYEVHQKPSYYQNRLRLTTELIEYKRILESVLTDLQRYNEKTLFRLSIDITIERFKT